MRGANRPKTAKARLANTSPRLRGEADSAGGRAGEGLSTVEPSRRHPLTFALRARLAADEGCEALSPQAGRGKAPAIRGRRRPGGESASPRKRAEVGRP